MHRAQHTRVGWMVVGIVGVGMLGLAFHGVRASRPAARLPDRGGLPDFALIDHHGQPVTRAQLTGSVWVADFIFTRCAGQCPLMSAQMAKLQEAFRGLPNVQLISFSVDPSHDSPGVLARYAHAYHAQAPRWRFVTGTESAIVRLAQEGFRLGVGKDGSAAEPITHSVRCVLVDHTGHIRGDYDATDPEAMHQLQADVRRLLQSPGPS